MHERALACACLDGNDAIAVVDGGNRSTMDAQFRSKLEELVGLTAKEVDAPCFLGSDNSLFSFFVPRYDTQVGNKGGQLSGGQ